MLKDKPFYLILAKNDGIIFNRFALHYFKIKYLLLLPV
jgi:hypothetical protein